MRAWPTKNAHAHAVAMCACWCNPLRYAATVGCGMLAPLTPSAASERGRLRGGSPSASASAVRLGGGASALDAGVVASSAAWRVGGEGARSSPMTMRYESSFWRCQDEMVSSSQWSHTAQKPSAPSRDCQIWVADARQPSCVSRQRTALRRRPPHILIRWGAHEHFGSHLTTKDCPLLP